MVPYIDLFAPLNPHLYRTLHSGPRPAAVHSATRNPPRILCREEETRANIARFGFSDALYAPHTVWFPTQTLSRRQASVLPTATVLHLNYQWSTEYFHFLTEVLPNVLLVHSAFPDWMPIHCPISRFTLAAFRWAGIPNPIIATPPPSGAVQWVPPYVECGNPSSQKIKALRTVVEAKARFESTHGILIRRHGTRELLNDEEVLATLRELAPHLTWVVYDMLPFDDTAELFSKAAWIVGPHGAGMTNMLFSPTGVQILECMPIRDTNVCYWHLAEMLGHSYSMLPLDCDARGNMHVDLDQLRTYARQSPTMVLNQTGQ